MTAAPGCATEASRWSQAPSCTTAALATAGQVLPAGYYHLDRLLGSAIRRGAEVGLCGTCMDARAVAQEKLVEGARRSSLEELTDWTLWADNVVSF
jgi:uncharacterized protein involved in oxidation of intracellular sulfur